jgi:hypothetical protein
MKSPKIVPAMEDPSFTQSDDMDQPVVWFYRDGKSPTQQRETLTLLVLPFAVCRMPVLSYMHS